MSKKSFEEKVEKLEEIVDILDSGDADLEETVKLYETGMKLSAELSKMIEDAKLKVIDITKKFAGGDEAETLF